MQYKSPSNCSMSAKRSATRIAVCVGAMMTLSLGGHLVDAAQADDGAKTYKIIAVLGPLGDPIFSTIEKGAVDAAKAAGVDSNTPLPMASTTYPRTSPG